MLALIILLVIALIIFLIGRITVGVELRYVGGKLTIYAKLCGLLKKIYPREKKPAPEKEKVIGNTHGRQIDTCSSQDLSHLCQSSRLVLKENG